MSDDEPRRGGRVIAVVVTYRRPKLLATVLDALRSQSVCPQAIVVVDNGSDEETRVLLDRSSNVTAMHMAKNTGGSGGFAAGIERAMQSRPDWIWLLDDDAVVRPDTLERLLDALDHLAENGERPAVLCSAVEEAGRLATMHRRRFKPETLKESVVPASRYTARELEIDIGSFVSFLVNSEAVRKVGLPDPRFFFAYDDIEYSLRLGQAGYRLWLVPGSRVDHQRLSHARLRHGPFGVKHYYNLRNRLIVYRRFGRRVPAWRWLRPHWEGLLLLLVAGRGRPQSIRWWWRAVRDSRHEPYVLEAGRPEHGGNTGQPSSRGDVTSRLEG